MTKSTLLFFLINMFQFCLPPTACLPPSHPTAWGPKQAALSSTGDHNSGPGHLSFSHDWETDRMGEGQEQRLYWDAITLWCLHTVKEVGMVLPIIHQ